MKIKQLLELYASTFEVDAVLKHYAADFFIASDGPELWGNFSKDVRAKLKEQRKIITQELVRQFPLSAVDLRENGGFAKPQDFFAEMQKYPDLVKACNGGLKSLIGDFERALHAKVRSQFYGYADESVYGCLESMVSYLNEWQNKNL